MGFWSTFTECSTLRVDRKTIDHIFFCQWTFCKWVDHMQIDHMQIDQTQLLFNDRKKLLQFLHYLGEHFCTLVVLFFIKFLVTKKILVHFVRQNVYVKMLVTFSQLPILSTENGLLVWPICKFDFTIDWKNTFLSMCIDFYYTSSKLYFCWKGLANCWIRVIHKMSNSMILIAN